MRITAIALKLNTVDGGGANFALHLQLTFLASRGHTVRLITLFPQQNKIAEPLQFELIEKYSTDGRFLNLQNFVFNVLKAEEANTDLYYLDGQALIWGGGAYRQKGGKKIVAAYINCYTRGMNLTTDDEETVTIQEHIISKIKNLWYGYKRWMWEKTIGIRQANNLDLIFTNSTVTKNNYHRYGFKTDQWIVLPLEMELRKTETQTIGQAPFSKQADELHILYAGRLIYDKGVDLLVKALHSKTLDNCRLHIVGDGPQKKRLQQMVKRLGLEKKVFFYPWVKPNDLTGFYRATDIFVHPCRLPEPFGRTIVEALSFGKPIITSAQSGSAWVAGEAGVTFTSGSVLELQQAILRFTKKETLPAYSILAKARASEFDFELMAPRFEAALLEITKKNHSNE